MSSLTRYLPNLLCSIGTITSRILTQTSNYHFLTTPGPSLINPGGLFNISARTNIRVHFPRPSERKRIKRHGWKVRMSTPSGRRIIMNRILKGRFVYTH